MLRPGSQQTVSSTTTAEVRVLLTPRGTGEQVVSTSDRQSAHDKRIACNHTIYRMVEKSTEFIAIGVPTGEGG